MHARLAEPKPSDPVLVPPLGGNRAIAERLRAMAVRGRPGVLGVVVETGGSTYRKPGALILLDADGTRIGALSGGCLEAELETRARAVLMTGIAADAHFDTSGDEDRVFGSGTGCGGSTRLLLLPLPAVASPLRDALIEADTHGLTATLALATGTDNLGAGEACVGKERYRFDRDGSPLDGAAELDAPIELTIRPCARLLLLGAGPETRPLLRLTRLLGWQVELAEHRERWARFADGSGIDCLHDDGQDALPALLKRVRFDAALVMNHNYHLDARCLSHLAASGIGYVGLLGPAARRDDLLAEIGADVAASLRPRLHAPVGLPLGGEGAEAIALAIAAQLQGEFSRDARA
ncbi:XdhC family protein [Dokdonella soli]|uniref:XdhC family protein n=1 Tax=Dokdonella soli TaxID=529810 RepID=A0ABP3TLE0_9GAMM